MNERRYRDRRDVTLLQGFNAGAISATGGCGFIHPGDIPQRLFNGNKPYDPAEVVTIWEDPIGIAGWVMASARHRKYDAQARPDLRTGPFAMNAMATAGVEYATVVNEGTNEASRALYASVGFAPWHLLDWYTKPV